MQKNKLNNVNNVLLSNIKKELYSNRLMLIGTIILLIITLSCVLLPMFLPNPNDINPGNVLQPPSINHLMGTDEFGRDVLARAMHGGRVSLIVGFSSMFVSTVIGTIIGVFSGYIGGRVDQFIMRFTDIFLALPSMLLMVILNAFLRPGLITLVMVLSMFSWAGVARITRAETMSLKERDFIIASENLGANSFNIIFKHIIPNVAGIVIVSATLRVGSAILSESSLSFLGLGVQIPQSSWGSMLQSAQKHILDAPVLAIIPGVFIFLTVLSFNFIGDGLRSAIEVK